MTQVLKGPPLKAGKAKHDRPRHFQHVKCKSESLSIFLLESAGVRVSMFIALVTSLESLTFM